MLEYGSKLGGRKKFEFLSLTLQCTITVAVKKKFDGKPWFTTLLTLSGLWIGSYSNDLKNGTRKYFSCVENVPAPVGWLSD